MAGTIPFGCGQCLPCRINRRRQWMWRQYLESLCHEDNSFITLTYAEEFLPAGGNLDPKALQLFIKRLRHRCSPKRFRFYAVGEYGGESGRPHYHLNLFGVSSFMEVGDLRVGGRLVGLAQHVAECWPSGHSLVGDFNERTAQYVCGYVVKKMTSRGDPRLQGRVPEFCRMSNRPGIGAEAMVTLGRTLLRTAQSWRDGDVPKMLRIGRRSIPLGRYLIGRLRKEVGFTDEYSQEVRAEQSYTRSVELLDLYLASVAAEPDGTFKRAYSEKVAQRILETEGRAKIFAQKRGLT